MTNKAYAVIQSVTGLSAPMSDLSDDFSGGSLDATKWATFSFGTGSSASQTGGEIQVSLSNSASKTSAGIWSVNTYDLTGSSAQFEVATLGDAMIAGDKTQIGMLLQVSHAQIESVSAIWTVLSEGTLYLGYYVGDTQTVATTLSYDTTNHKYLRVRESSGTIYWDTSPDASTWTNQESVADPIAVTDLYVVLYGQQFGSGVASTVAVDNFNTGVTAASYAPGVVTASAVVLSSDDATVSKFTVTANFDYGDTVETIREDVAAAIRTAASDATLEVEFIAG